MDTLEAENIKRCHLLLEQITRSIYNVIGNAGLMTSDKLNLLLSDIYRTRTTGDVTYSFSPMGFNQI